MSQELIIVERPRPALTVLTLNRPERCNALTITLMKQLCETLDSLASDTENRVVIFAGNGPAFCSGLDLREAADVDVAITSAEWVHRMFHTVAQSPLVTIAAAHGAAFAGGGGLLAACDLAVGAADLQIAFPEARRGLVPALAAGLLRNKLSGGDVRQLLLCAEPITAQEALQMGLVHRVVPNDKLWDEAMAVAASVLAGAPDTIRLTKELLASPHSTFAEQSAQLLAAHKRARSGDEAREGLAAFLEKRKPNWQ